MTRCDRASVVRGWAVAGCVLLAGSLVSFGQEGSRDALLIRGATLIDGTGSPPKPGVAILVSGGVIRQIGPPEQLMAAAKDAKVIDATGRYVLPGLIDSHVHYLEWETPYYPYFGVTTIFDLGNLSEWIVAQREAWKAGRMPGARLYTTGNHLNGPAKPGDELRSADRAGWIHIVTDRTSTLDALNTLMSYPVDALKIQERLNEESLRTIVEFAQQNRLAVVGHTTNARDAALLGVRFMEHMYPIARAASSKGRDATDRDMEPERFDDLIALLVEKKVVINPTVVLAYSAVSRHNDEFRKQDEALFPQFTGVPQYVKDTWMAEFYRSDETTRRNKQAGFEKTRQFLTSFVRRGGMILSGTDAGRRVMPGLSLHREMQMLVELGLTPMEAIKATTAYPAQFLGLDREIGTVEVGKKADLLIVTGDPLADISNTQKIAYVILDGRVLDRKLDYKNPLPRPVTDEPIPFIDSVAPLRFVQGQTDGVVTIRGKNFIPDSVVQIGEVRLQPRRNNSDGSLAVALPASVTRAVGTYQVSVVNPLPAGGQSNSRYVFVDFAAARPKSTSEQPSRRLR